MQEVQPERMYNLKTEQGGEIDKNKNIVASLSGFGANVDKWSVIESLHHFTRPEHIDLDPTTGTCHLRFLDESHFDAFRQKIQGDRQLFLSVTNQGTKRIKVVAEEPPKSQRVNFQLRKLNVKESEAYFTKAT
jgi:hypothetical protein